MTNSRTALVEAAFEEFTAKGYEAATVVGIAERAGVTTGALYAHFSGKLDLLLATVGLTPIADIARTVGGSGWGSRSFGEGLSERPDRRRVLLLDVIVVARRDPEVAKILRGGLEAYVRATARVIEGAAARGSVDPVVPPEGVSRLLAVLNLGMVVFAALDAPTPASGGFQRLVEALLPPSERGTVASDASDTDPAGLGEVRARAAAVARSQDTLHVAIAAAIDRGHSLRQVGAAAGLSHEAVRRLAMRAKRGARPSP